MKRKIGTFATCGALMFSFGVPAATADTGPVDRGKAEKCAKLTEKYNEAVKKGQVKKANRLLEKLAKKCGAG